jgi:glycine dehydrogenase subunit 1
MYIPHTEVDREEMLEIIGVERVEDLFTDVPPAHRFPKLNIPPALTEMEVVAELENISRTNQTAKELVCFLGAGAYHHYTPAAVDSILRRGEFYTAYTPYQPEISQGTLQIGRRFAHITVALSSISQAMRMILTPWAVQMLFYPRSMRTPPWLWSSIPTFLDASMISVK